MTTISATVLADSIAGNGIRLTSLLLRYPRFIHSEVMTHRVFSRNASSSRAIPVARLIKDAMEDTAVPIYWGKNQPGMQAGEDWNAPVIIGLEKVSNEWAWYIARNRAIEVARGFADAGYHKQIVNRLLEPFVHINVVITATAWGNFFDLRDHEDAEPHIAHLARDMKKALENSTPKFIRPGQWHLPFIKDGELVRLAMHAMHLEADTYMLAAKVSAARCARTSFLTHEGKETTIDQDLELFGKLLVAEPVHASPAEHQATPNETSDWDANFRGWKQLRKVLGQ